MPVRKASAVWNGTLKEGVEVMIREDVPEVEQILDITDHSSGQSPYYK